MVSDAQVENDRVVKQNDVPLNEKADYVLYWSQMNRRAHFNHALDYAIALGNQLDLPVLFYEGLTCTYRQANDRLHTFVIEAVPGTGKALKERGIGYAFYLRRKRSDANDIVYRLSERAAAVVTDDYPTFIAAEHNARVPARINRAFFTVDSSCIVPMNRFQKHEYAAYTIRPKITKLLPEFLHPAPELKPKRAWRGKPPDFHVKVTPGNIAELVASCEVDHSVPPSTAFRGGSDSAGARLRLFLTQHLKDYADARNEPSTNATSNLSPYLHFGQISSLEIALQTREYAGAHRLNADAFLEELIVRRELAFNYARFATDLEGFGDLPEWARKTMREHARDERDPVYSPQQLEQAQTYDALWNATQKELLLRGKMHGYYRMYWGKKIIEWTRTYADALQLMIHLHDRYALDGRDPNTYTNILWCFGLHDRPWFQRPIFGVLRYLSIGGMERKTDTKAYIEQINAIAARGTDPLSLATVER